MEQATGLERKELEALMQGKEVILIDAHLETAVCYCVRLCLCVCVCVGCRIRSTCRCSPVREALV